MAKRSATDNPEEIRRQRKADIVDIRFDVDIPCRCNPTGGADSEGCGACDGGFVTGLSVGGRWNKSEKCYVDDVDACESVVVARLHAGQVKTMSWFKAWLEVHAGRRDDPPAFDPEDYDDAGNETSTERTDPSEVYSALLAGGRRSGKTRFAMIAAVVYAVLFPGSIVWILSPSRGKDDTKPDELRRYVSRMLAPEWMSRQTHATGWELINGSSIMLKSGHTSSDPDAIKEGEAHLIILNESQKMKYRVYVVARGAIVDKSGLVLCCANPPVETKDEQWVSKFAADASAGRRESVYVHMNPLENPYINRRALMALRKELDERTYAIEVLGEFRAALDSVAWNWTIGECEIPPPSPTWRRGMQIACPRTGLIDVTTEFLEHCEEGEGLKLLIGLDVQIHPHIGGPAIKFFAPPGAKMHRDNLSLVGWIVDEYVLQGGDEEDWCDMLRQREVDPDTTLIVCDASGAYQHSRRRAADSPPPEWTGKGSFELIRGKGYRNIVTPSRRFRDKNPDIVDRWRAFTSLIKPMMGPRRFFCDPARAPKCAQSIRDWKTVNGRPRRSQWESHLGDASSYPIVRLFPRIMRSDNPADVTVKSRVDLPEPSPFAAVRRAPGPPRRRERQGL